MSLLSSLLKFLPSGIYLYLTVLLVGLSFGGYLGYQVEEIRLYPRLLAAQKETLEVQHVFDVYKTQVTLDIAQTNQVSLQKIQAADAKIHDLTIQLNNQKQHLQSVSQQLTESLQDVSTLNQVPLSSNTLEYLRRLRIEQQHPSTTTPNP